MQKLSIKIVDLNNKSRKGTYIYIRDPKTGKSGYYKYDGTTFIDAYVDYFVENRKLAKKAKFKRINKRKFIKSIGEIMEDKASKYTKKFVKRYKLRTKKYKKIGKLFRKGAIQVAYPFTKIERDKKNVYKQLLEPLVLDKGLLRIIIKNAKKFKFRLYYRTKVFAINQDTGKEEQIGYIEDYNKTIEEYIGKYKESFRKGQYIGSQYIKRQKPALKYITGRQTANGKLTRMLTGIEFRKGGKK